MAFTTSDAAAIRQALRPEFNKIEHRFDLVKQEFAGVRREVRSARRDLGDLDGRLAAVQEDLAKVKAAVVDLLVTDRHLRNLVRELRAQGVAVDERRVFAS